MSYQDIINTIRQRKDELKLTTTDIGNKLGMKRFHVSHNLGKASSLTAKNLIKLLDAVGLKIQIVKKE
jgi:hypothetical protein